MDALFSSPAAERKEDILMKTLKDLDEVKKKLQQSDTSIGSAHACFDTVAEGYPSLSSGLNYIAQTVQVPHFESGLPKIEEFHEESMASLEKNRYPGCF